MIQLVYISMNQNDVGTVASGFAKDKNIYPSVISSSRETHASCCDNLLECRNLTYNYNGFGPLINTALA